MMLARIILFKYRRSKWISKDRKERRFMRLLRSLKKKRVVPFDVPGHKRGRGNPELVHLLGEKCVGLDAIQ